MKYVLDERDKSKPWYKGMSNMTEEEMNEWMKRECKSALIVSIELLIMGIVGIVVYFISEDKAKALNVIYLIAGIIAGMGLLTILIITSQYRHMILVKEERQ